MNFTVLYTSFLLLQLLPISSHQMDRTRNIETYALKVKRYVINFMHATDVLIISYAVEQCELTMLLKLIKVVHPI